MHVHQYTLYHQAHPTTPEAEIYDDAVEFQSKNLEQVANLGIVIPIYEAKEYEGHRKIFPSHPRFSEAFTQYCQTTLREQGYYLQPYLSNKG